MDFETVRYETEGQIATITLNRPEAANAQNSQMIDELDAAFDRADADDDGPGRRARGRGQALLGRSRPQGAARGRGALVGDAGDARGQAPPRAGHVLRQARARSATCASSTIAAVQGTCSAAGLMLACMCDLIVAADDAAFSNPVLRMSGVGVELLVEPWELGPRKAKEFLFCAQEFGADGSRALRARQPGRAPRRARTWRPGRWPSRSRSCRRSPPRPSRHRSTTWSTCMGQRESWRYHFMLHQFVSNTPTALGQGRSPAEPAAWTRSRRNKAERESTWWRDRSRAPRPRSRHPHRRAVLRGPARRAGRGGHQDRAAARRRLHARDRAVRPGRYSLFWAVEGRGRKSVTLDLRTPEGQDVFRRLAATADVVVENFRPGHARAMEHRARPLADASSPCASRCSARTARTRSGRASTASASATAGCCISPAIPTARRCASA